MNIIKTIYSHVSIGRSLKYVILACAIVAIAASVTLCLSSSASDTPALPPDKCIFIDHHVHSDGVIIEGQGSGLMIDFPTYSFDKEQQRLNGMVNFDVNDSLQVVYGDGQSLSGAMGGGAATMLYGVYALPYEQRGLMIKSVNSSGAVTMRYRNETIILEPGEEWEKVTSDIITTNYGNVSRINETSTDRIINYGLINKNDVVKR